MTTPIPACVSIVAPAKLNLGLEVLGRRLDGFHELATIYVAVSLVDNLRFVEASGLHVQCSHPDIVERDNLVLRALHAVRARSPGRGARVEISKEIPVAAGLGGASSDAAAALLGLRELWRLQMTDRELATVAAELGSDVPFFLQGGCALGRGRGERLEQLPLPTDTRFVVVVPSTVIHRKTATLYAALTPADYSAGHYVQEQAVRLRNDGTLDPTLFANSFTRALYALRPDLASLPDVMRLAGAATVELSGAGTAHYAMFTDPLQADDMAAKLRRRLQDHVRVIVVSPVPMRGAVSVTPTM